MLHRTTEEVSSYFKEHGCELFDEYNGCMGKMKYRCSCGQFSEINWNNFARGKRCGNCTKWGQKKKRSVEQVKQMFAERGCEFLDIEFNGIHYKHQYRCKCGRISSISLAAFMYQKQLCHACGLEKNLGPNHHGWKGDREQYKLMRRLKYRMKNALKRTLAALKLDKLDYTHKLLGYTAKQLQEHITGHPNWILVKDGDWHLDHYFPLQAFLEYKIHDVKLINNLDNLQPLSQAANNQKKDKYNKVAFERWLATKGITV